MNEAKLRQDALAIFHAGLAAASPGDAIKKHCRRIDDLLIVADRLYRLNDYKNVYVIGAGKAGAAMANAVEELLLDEISCGVVNVKYGYLAPLKKVKLNEAGHPIPDTAGLKGCLEIVEILEQAKADDLVICLISGGGSALLPLPADGISLAEKQTLTDKLLACGADINEINAVRKHISKIKGGQLARLAMPATLVTLILSDVIGDPLDVIASGPTVPDPSTFADVKALLHKYELWQNIPAPIRLHVEKGIWNEIPETPKAGDGIFAKTQNVIVANNFQALAAAKIKAETLGYNTLLLSSAIAGETRDVAGVHAAIAREIINSNNPVKPPACVISGGETTVTLRGRGKGGRNQEFVLQAAFELDNLPSVVILSAGTDGTDGPTDAAGAVCDGRTIQRSIQSGLDAQKHLDNNDAYPFFAKLGDLIKTGPTNTNVMDLRLILAGES